MRVGCGAGVGRISSTTGILRERRGRQMRDKVIVKGTPLLLCWWGLSTRQ